ncbi:hypothetical protein, partial [Mycobacterium sp.]|uniref:hypothetical protein n=1 Tax=Mycobacterium sp. TaxID=1785 RepID=UPI003C740A5B
MATAMSPSAAFNAIIDAITRPTPAHATTSVQVRRRCDASVTSGVAWSELMSVSTTLVRPAMEMSFRLSARSHHETIRLVHRPVVSISNIGFADGDRKP